MQYAFSVLCTLKVVELIQPCILNDAKIDPRHISATATQYMLSELIIQEDLDEL